MRLKLTSALLLLVFSQPAWGQSDRVNTAIKVLQARAAEALAVSNRQERALNAATVRFITLGSSEPVDIPSVNSLLDGLHRDLPQFERTYRTKADFCPILRALRQERTYLSNRKMNILQRQMSAAVASMTFNSVMLALEVSKLTGQPVKTSGIESDFLTGLEDDLEDTFDDGTMMALPQGLPSDECA